MPAASTIVDILLDVAVRIVQEESADRVEEMPDEGSTTAAGDGGTTVGDGGTTIDSDGDGGASLDRDRI